MVLDIHFFKDMDVEEQSQTIRLGTIRNIVVKSEEGCTGADSGDVCICDECEGEGVAVYSGRLVYNSILNLHCTE